MIAGEESFKLLIKAGLTELVREQKTLSISLLMPAVIVLIFSLASANIQPFSELGLSLLQYSFPGILLLCLFSVSIFGFALPIIKMTNNGVIKTIQVTPVKTETFILTQIIVRLILACSQISFFLFAGVLLNYIQFVHFFPFIFISLLGVMMVFPIGYYLTSLFKQTEMASRALLIIIIPILFFSGAFCPLQTLPEAFQSIAYLLPFTYFIEITHYLLFGIKGKVPVLAGVLVIFIVSVIFYFLSTKSFGGLDILHKGLTSVKKSLNVRTVFYEKKQRS